MSTIQVADKPTLDRVDTNTRGLSGLAGIDDLIIACFNFYRIDNGCCLVRATKESTSGKVQNTLSRIAMLDNKTFSTNTFNINGSTLNSGMNIAIPENSFPDNFSDLDYLYFLFGSNVAGGTSIYYITKMESFSASSPTAKSIPDPPKQKISSLKDTWNSLSDYSGIWFTDINVTKADSNKLRIQATIPNASSSTTPLIGLVWRLKD